MAALADLGEVAAIGVRAAVDLVDPAGAVDSVVVLVADRVGLTADRVMAVSKAGLISHSMIPLR